jgi:flagellar motor switch protein FliG
VDTRTLTVALKTASEKLKNTLLSCISKRAAETVREEITFLGQLKLKEIEAAQAQIIDVVRQLEAEGEVDLDEVRDKSRH